MRINKKDLTETILPNDFFKSTGKRNFNMDSRPTTAVEDDPIITEPTIPSPENLKKDDQETIALAKDVEKTVENSPDVDIKDLISEFIAKLIEHEISELKIQEDENFIYLVKDGKIIMMKIERDVKLKDGKVEIRYQIMNQNDEVWDISDKINDFEKKQGNNVLFVSIKPEQSF